MKNFIISKKYIFIFGFVLLLVNEFSIVMFDPNPPLSNEIKFLVRLFDISIIIIIFFGNLLFRNYFSLINKILNFLGIYVFPTFFFIIILDFSLTMMGYGYPKNYDQENIYRYPSPGDTFAGKPNISDHNEYGFRGEFEDENFLDSFNIAFFGGSTGYHGSPNIAVKIKEILEHQQTETIVNIYNFSSVSSNHTQHLHRMIKFIDKYKFDLIIFYGGYNETIQYLSYDPRAGYPFNFFYRNELKPFMQFIIKYSSILGEIDKRTGYLSGLKEIREDIITDNKWYDQIIENYIRDLKIANKLSSITIPNRCGKNSFLSISQPINDSNLNQYQKKMYNKYLNIQNKIAINHIDLTYLNNQINFTDIVHLKQNSRNKIATEISKIILEKIFNECDKI